MIAIARSSRYDFIDAVGGGGLEMVVTGRDIDDAGGEGRLVLALRERR